ncbi:hypothetical protein ACP275_09G135300 [Erythranthe tilingii]
MEAENEQDPFAVIFDFCRPTASQEAEFPNCPMDRKSEMVRRPDPVECSSSSDPTSSEQTPIRMVSLPATSSSSRQQSEEDPVFHTPPEHHNHSQLSSSEDQNLDELLSRAVGDGGCCGSEKVRVSEGELEDEADSHKLLALIDELERDTVPVDDTEKIASETQVIETVDIDEVIVADSEDAGEDLDGIDVNRGEDRTENLDGIEVNRGENRTEDLDGIEVNRGENRTEDLDGIEVNRGENRTCEENTCSTGSLNSSRIEEDIHNMKSDRVREDEKICEDGCPEIDDGKKKRRKLPASLFDTRAKNVEGSSTSNGGLVNFVDILKVAVCGGEDGGGAAGEDDVDLLETAKRRGLTFPRPRWWPPEGDF